MSQAKEGDTISWPALAVSLFAISADVEAFLQVCSSRNHKKLQSSPHLAFVVIKSDFFFQNF
jgi:hypothetical protein